MRKKYSKNTRDHVPNKTTVKAIRELNEMESNPKKYKRYDSFGEIIKDI